MPETYYRIPQDSLDDILTAYRREDDYSFLKQLGVWIRYNLDSKDWKELADEIFKNAEAYEDKEWMKLARGVLSGLDGR